MADVRSDSKLIQDYEAIRQREYTLITNLLDVLPKIDNIGEQRVSQVRDALFHADHPYMMVLVGPFSSGKSSIINALLGDKDLLRIGVTPTTDRIQVVRWGEDAQNMGTAGEADTVFYPAPILRRVAFVDTPGLESIFKEHEETTRKFLHRADAVLLIMLATQAMGMKNLDYLRLFKEYGKKVILVLNQADLLTTDERETVQQFVQEQARQRVGFDPEIWFVSAKQGLAASNGDKRDETLWKASGLKRIEDYIADQLQDADRMRQKLQTPLQIVQTVHQSALTAVRANQSTFDRYRSIVDNVEQQLTAQKREQEKIVLDVTKEVERRFRETGDRSKEAIYDIFQFSRAANSLGRGLFELTLANFFRRKDAESYLESTFKRYKVFEPIDELPQVVDKLAPRLEGQDMQDIDDLVRYGTKELSNLPEAIREKAIGVIQAPAKYDRSFMQDVRKDLEDLEEDARFVETEKLEQIRRNTLLYLAVWELIMVVLIVALFNTWGALIAATDSPISAILLILLLGGALLGFAWLPLRGRMIHTEYVNRLLKLQARYTALLTEAADKQIEYGLQLRRETIAPLTRLVEAQSSTQDEQLRQLQKAEQEIVKIESDLNALGKRKFLGMTF